MLVEFNEYARDFEKQNPRFKLMTWVEDDDGFPCLNYPKANDGDAPINPFNPGEHIHLGILQPGAAATENSAGYKDCYECSCGKFFEDAACTVEITDIAKWKSKGGNGYIAPLSGEKDTPTSPQTGDTSNMTLWVMLMALSAMGLCVCLIFGKRKRTVK